MASTPRAKLADDVTVDLLCAICGADALHVVHLDNLPDFIECADCKSAFIMEDGGDRVLYGQISDDYPQTAQFALRQWVWIEAVDARATEERPASELDSELESFPAEPEPPSAGIPEPENDLMGLRESLDVQTPSAMDTGETIPLEEQDTPPDFAGAVDLPEPGSDTFDDDAFISGEEPGSALGQAEPEDFEPFEPSLETETGSMDEREEDGFGWLGGLADEDTPLEEPDRAPSSELPPEGAFPTDSPAADEGLSADDLDDLFRTDEGVVEAPDYSSGFAERIPEAPEDAVEPEWVAPEFDLEDDAEDDDVQPPAEWLQRDEVVPEPAFSDVSPPEEALQFADDDDADDFLSSLRDSAAIPLESQPLQDASLEPPPAQSEEPAPPDWALGDDEAMDSEAMAARMQAITADEPALDADPSTSGDDEPAEEPPMEVEQEVIHYRETDPPPGFRHRVVMRGDRIIFPGGECAHCGRTPVKGQLAIAGSLPSGQGMGDRKPTRFQVPLCAECRTRAAQMSEDAKSARLQGHLISAIVAMGFVVAALALGLVEPAGMQLADWFILIILLVVGYAGPALFLLNRVSDYPPPLDAAYVRTTLLIPSEEQGLETAFEWRNAEYAQRFHEANHASALGNVTSVKDRLTLGNF